MKTPLNQLLSNQYLIFTFIKEKLEIVNFIRWGYDNDLPELIDNRFLHTVAHIFYRSIVVEMCTLFDDHKHQSNHFHLLIKRDKIFIQELNEETITDIKSKLQKSAIYFTDELREIRNEEISHFRFKDRTLISLNQNYLIELNKLLEIAKDILQSTTQNRFNNLRYE